MSRTVRNIRIMRVPRSPRYKSRERTLGQESMEDERVDRCTVRCEKDIVAMLTSYEPGEYKYNDTVMFETFLRAARQPEP